MNPANYLKIKNKIPSNVNILAVSKGFKSQEIKTIQKIGQNDFGESKFQEAFEKTNVDAVAAANIFHYRDQSVYLAKNYLFENNLPTFKRTRLCCLFF